MSSIQSETSKSLKSSKQKKKHLQAHVVERDASVSMLDNSEDEQNIDNDNNEVENNKGKKKKKEKEKERERESERENESETSQSESSRSINENTSGFFEFFGFRNSTTTKKNNNNEIDEVDKKKKKIKKTDKNNNRSANDDDDEEVDHDDDNDNNKEGEADDKMEGKKTRKIKNKQENGNDNKSSKKKNNRQKKKNDSDDEGDADERETEEEWLNEGDHSDDDDDDDDDDEENEHEPKSMVDDDDETMLSAGRMVTAHFVNRSGVNTVSSMNVFVDDGTLFWCAPNERRFVPRQSIELAHVQRLLAGHHSSLFQQQLQQQQRLRTAAAAAAASYTSVPLPSADLCFAVLKADGAGLHLVAPSSNVRAWWMHQLHAAILRSGNVPTAESGTIGTNDEGHVYLGDATAPTPLGFSPSPSSPSKLPAELEHTRSGTNGASPSSISSSSSSSSSSTSMLTRMMSLSSPIVETRAVAVMKAPPPDELTALLFLQHGCLVAAHFMNAQNTDVRTIMLVFLHGDTLYWCPPPSSSSSSSSFTTKPIITGQQLSLHSIQSVRIGKPVGVGTGVGVGSGGEEEWVMTSPKLAAVDDDRFLSIVTTKATPFSSSSSSSSSTASSSSLSQFLSPFFSPASSSSSSSTSGPAPPSRGVLHLETSSSLVRNAMVRALVTATLRVGNFGIPEKGGAAGDSNGVRSWSEFHPLSSSPSTNTNKKTKQPPRSFTFETKHAPQQQHDQTTNGNGDEQFVKRGGVLWGLAVNAQTGEVCEPVMSAMTVFVDHTQNNLVLVWHVAAPRLVIVRQELELNNVRELLVINKKSNASSSSSASLFSFPFLLRSFALSSNRNISNSSSSSSSSRSLYFEATSPDLRERWLHGLHALIVKHTGHTCVQQQDNNDDAEVVVRYTYERPQNENNNNNSDAQQQQHQQQALQQKVVELTKQRDFAIRELQDVVKQHDTTRKQVNELKQQQQQPAGSSELQQQVEDLTKQCELWKQKVAVLDNIKDDLTNQLELQSNMSSDHASALSSLAGKVEMAQQERDVAISELADHVAAKQELETKLGTVLADMTKLSSDHEVRVMSLSNELSSIQSKHATLQRQLDEYRATNNSNNNNNKNNNEQVMLLEQEKQKIVTEMMLKQMEVKKQLDAVQQQHSVLQQQVDDGKKTIIRVTSELDESKKKIESLTASNSNKQSELQGLRDVVNTSSSQAQRLQQQLDEQQNQTARERHQAEQTRKQLETELTNLRAKQAKCCVIS